MNPAELTIEDLLEEYRTRSLTPSEAIQCCLDAIDKKNKSLNAFLDLKPEESIKRARELDLRFSEFAKLPLFGVPIAVKDNFLVKGWRATAGSKILENYISPYTATSVERLEAAGAIVIGKTNCDEFAMGSSNENSAYGCVKNPWDLSRVPGGSSGGSAAAVAGLLCSGALGTDTGGSIRQPASLCGIVGIKPSYGRVSRYGIIAYASSLDQVGPLGRSVWDVARLLEVMAGYDGKDATSSRAIVPQYTSILSRGSVRNMKIGISKEWLTGLDWEMLSSFDDAIRLIQKESGAHVVEISLPHTKYSLSCYYLIAPSEASSNLARYDGVHYGFRVKAPKDGEYLYFQSRGQGFGKEVKMRIMLGTYALSSGYYEAYYLKANQVRRLIQRDFEEAFQKCDCIAVPTSPTTAFALGEKLEDPIQMYLSDIFTLPVNLAGLPGISVPCGIDSKKLPIGIQFIGRPFDELNLFSIARAFEETRGPFSSIPRGTKE